MNYHITLTPAYGRDYRSKDAVIKDLETGKDFILHDLSSPWDGKPCSLRDFPAGTTVNIRYNKLRQVLVYHVG